MIINSDPDGNISYREWEKTHMRKESRIREKVLPYDDWCHNVIEENY